MATQVPMSQEELDVVTKEMQEVLEKHNAVMSTQTTIVINKVSDESDTEENKEETTNSKTEEGS